MGSLRASFSREIEQDEDGAACDQDAQDEDSAVSEKFLGQDVDDLVLPGVEQPVVLAGKEQGVEYHEGPVEVQRGQGGDDEEQNAGPRPNMGAGRCRPR